MHSTIALTAQGRKTLLHLYRHPTGPDVGRRARTLVPLAEGCPWDTVAAALFTATSTIARWQRRFLDAGLDGLVGQRPGRRPWLSRRWAGAVVGRVSARSPRDLGFWRSRRTCAVAALLLWPCFRLAVSRGAARRWLRQADLVWGRPRPAPRRRDPPARPNCGHAGGCWRTCRPTRWPSSRTRWTSTATPRSAACGCAKASRRWPRRRGAMRSATGRGR